MYVQVTHGHVNKKNAFLLLVLLFIPITVYKLLLQLWYFSHFRCRLSHVKNQKETVVFQIKSDGKKKIILAMYLIHVQHILGSQCMSTFILVWIFLSHPKSSHLF